MMRFWIKGLLLSLLLLCIPYSLWGQSRLLQVVDRDSKLPLEAVAVLVAPKTMLLTNVKGMVTLPEDITKETLIEVRYLAYRTKQMSFEELKAKQGIYTVYLEPNHKQLASVLVKAKRKETALSAVSTKVSAQQIDKALGKSLANLLDATTGLSTIQTGANTAKPVIHGMHGNRILIVNEGVRQSGQQWGDAHAPEVDFSSSNIIHVVKGAEAVRYGSEAMGGVILMEQKLLPYHKECVKGLFSSYYASNGRAFGGNLALEGSLPFYRNIAYRFEGKYSNAGDHHTANYLLNNTGHRSNNIKASLGWEKGNFNLEGTYIRFDEESATLLTANLGNVERLLETIEEGRPNQEFIKPFSRRLDYPRESVLHETFMLKANYEHSSLGKLKYLFSYQKDKRNEYRIRRNNNSHIPELALNLHTYQNQLSLQNQWKGFDYELGGQVNFKDNYSQANTGVPPIIPNYTSLEWGTYLLMNYQKQKWDFDLGFRYDGTQVKATSYDNYGTFYYDENAYDCFTYSLGAKFQANKRLKLLSNFGLAWRSPHVFELYSDGVQHGSGAYVKGNKHLDSERGYKWITSIHYKDEYVNVVLSAYLQWVKNFIYDQAKLLPNGSPALRQEISGNYPIFEYRQTNAFFRGADLDVDFYLSKDWTYTKRATLVLANEMNTKSYLPHIPPFRIDEEVKWCRALTKDLHLDLMLGVRFVFQQDRFDPHKDLISYTPEAYQLWTMSSKLSWRLNKQLNLSCSLIGENLFNKEYKEYTNRARYYAHDLGRNIRAIFSLRF